MLLSPLHTKLVTTHTKDEKITLQIGQEKLEQLTMERSNQQIKKCQKHFTDPHF
jgi:hypothetical protein